MCIVLISAPGNVTLQGFLLEARDPDETVALEEWNNFNGQGLTQTLRCNGVKASALTNADDSDKSIVLANYTVPIGESLKEIEFWYDCYIS